MMGDKEMRKTSLMGEYTPGAEVMGLKRPINGLFRSLTSNKTKRDRKALRLNMVESLRGLGLGLAMAMVLSVNVGGYPAAAGSPADLTVTADGRKLSLELKDEWKEYAKHRTFKGELELYLPQEGKDLYRLRITFPPEIGAKFSDVGGYSSGYGLFFNFGLAGTIMLSIEDDKARFVGSPQLYYKYTKGRFWTDDGAELKENYGSDITDKPEYGRSQEMKTENPVADFLKAIKIGRIAEFVIGVAPVVGDYFGPYYSAVQLLAAFKEVPKQVFAIATERPGVYRTESSKNVEAASQPLPNFSDDQHHELQAISWKKLPSGGEGHTLNCLFRIQRLKPDETPLYIRALLGYTWRTGNGWNSPKWPFKNKYIEIEWEQPLPPLKEIPVEQERYQLIPRWRTWEEAKANCEKRGGHLVTVDSEEENEIVTQLLKDGGYRTAWIGLTDKDQEKKWKWVTQESSSYVNWASGEPNDAGGREDCVEIHSASGRWNDWGMPNNAEQTNPYVCEFGVREKPPTVTISVSPEEVEVGETFRVLLKSEDDVGLQSMWWWGEDTGIPELDKRHTARIFGKSATSGWRTTATEPGTFTLAADAQDSAGHQASEGEGIAYGTVTVMCKGRATTTLTFKGAFDDNRKTDLSKYRLSIKLNDRQIFSGSPPGIKHAAFRKIMPAGKDISNFNDFEITFGKCLLKKGRNKLEATLSGVDRNHWFCWDSFDIGGAEEGWSYWPATKYDDSGAPLGILQYAVSGNLWPYSPDGADGVRGGESTKVFFPY
jgi:hypothetical protein